VIGIFDYLMKPPNTTDINNLLKRAHSEYTEKRYIVNFKWQGLAYALEVSEIVYLEGYSRHIAFFTPDEENFTSTSDLDILVDLSQESTVKVSKLTSHNVYSDRINDRWSLDINERIEPDV